MAAAGPLQPAGWLQPVYASLLLTARQPAGNMVAKQQPARVTNVVQAAAAAAPARGKACGSALNSRATLARCSDRRSATPGLLQDGARLWNWAQSSGRPDRRPGDLELPPQPDLRRTAERRVDGALAGRLRLGSRSLSSAASDQTSTSAGCACNKAFTSRLAACPAAGCRRPPAASVAACHCPAALAGKYSAATGMVSVAVVTTSFTACKHVFTACISSSCNCCAARFTALQIYRGICRKYMFTTFFQSLWRGLA